MEKLNYRLVKFIEVNNFDALVEEVYGKPYKFQQQDGCMERGIVHVSVPEKYEEVYEANDEIPFEVNGSEMCVKFDIWLNTPVEEVKRHFKSEWEAELFYERNFYPPYQMVLNDLHTKGLIDEGDYIINIDW